MKTVIDLSAYAEERENFSKTRMEREVKHAKRMDKTIKKFLERMRRCQADCEARGEPMPNIE